jgi:uncharacterized protein
MAADDRLTTSLLAQMLRHEFYPHETSGQIELVQTHISYLFLTGRYAYKVKKPVNFGFLDFSTLERRCHFCEEEVRLNQRGAPGLYLGVVPIRRSSGGDFTFEGAGEVIEYAVKMRQFPRGSLFSDLLEAGKLGEGDIRSLARVVADYHAAAPPDRSGRFGDPQTIRAGLRQDHQESERFLGWLQTPQRLGETRAYVEQLVGSLVGLVRQRIADGFVRECHGDLHLDNICHFEGRTLLFDCIEFNEEFRWVDVMHDVGFVAMDLAARARPDLSTLFTNEYAERTGDWTGLRVLPLYLSRQAYVRAKVNSILAADAQAGPETRERATLAARRYYELAWQYARQPRRGRLIVVCGPSGSGKSTVARHLARRLGAVHLRSDAVRKHLAGTSLDERGGAAIYSKDMTQRTYRRLIDLALPLAVQGSTVILDARYSRRDQRQSLLDAAAIHGLPILFAYCDASPDVLRARLQARTADIADANADLVESQRREEEPFTPAEEPHVLRLDATRPADALAARIQEALDPAHPLESQPPQP